MMRAADHTAAMLRWWSDVHVDHADVGVRDRDGRMMVHANLALADLPLPWARAANALGGDVYLRPSRGLSWPVVLLDDVRSELALKIAAKYAALVIYTSETGGCQVWLRCASALAEDERHQMQRWLAKRCGADPAATSGAQFGRAAGFKNWKRGGCWVNTVSTNHTRPPWDPPIVIAKPPPQRRSRPGSPIERDHSPSAREWGWVCSMLEAGMSSDAVYHVICHELGTTNRPSWPRTRDHPLATN